MLKAMANLIRPATDRRTQRHNKSPSPPAATTNATHDRHHEPENRNSGAAAPIHEKAGVATRRQTSRATTQIFQSPPPQTGSRKRPASALDDATTGARPPTKLTVTQPHGELIRITNGVPKSLGIATDDLLSAGSTPDARPRARNLAVPAQTPQQQTPGTTDKRSLRSQDGGSRMKSDLAVYFSNYDDVIAGVEKSPNFLAIDAPIYIVDEPITEPSCKSASPSRSRKARPSTPTPTRQPSNASIIPPSQSSTSFPEIEYSTITNIVNTDTEEDPLADLVYFAQHRRAERKEKQLRNIEKERAMHEKVQLERLLDGLQGPDWLKVMGITGVTDGERKDWEPKRDYFVKEVETLVDKFRLWKEQEKRVRAGREAALAKEEEEDDESEIEPTEPRKPNSKQPRAATPLKASSPPKPRRPPRPHGFLLPLIPPEPTTPFQSFYSKPHLRAAALGKQRHGRNASAFGHPIPEWETHEFELPEDFVTPEFLRDNARKRRRRKRESGASSGAK